MCLNTMCADTDSTRVRARWNTRRRFRWSALRRLVIVVVGLLAPARVADARSDEAKGPSIVVANDNRRAAGEGSDRRWRVSLRAGRGVWQPEGPNGPRLEVEALG